MIKKGTNNLSDCDFNSGEIIMIDKPLNWTSFDAVSKIRNSVGVKKAGHAGTLDPMATGLLIICTGKKTKEILFFQDLKKTYTGSILLGKKSKSMDLETELIGGEDITSIKNEDISLYNPTNPPVYVEDRTFKVDSSVYLSTLLYGIHFLI